MLITLFSVITICQVNVSKAFFSTNKKMKLIAPMWFKRKKVMRNRAGVVRRPKVVGGKKIRRVRRTCRSLPRRIPQVLVDCSVSRLCGVAP